MSSGESVECSAFVRLRFATGTTAGKRVLALKRASTAERAEVLLQGQGSGVEGDKRTFNIQLSKEDDEMLPALRVECCVLSVERLCT